MNMKPLVTSEKRYGSKRRIRYSLQRKIKPLGPNQYKILVVTILDSCFRIISVTIATLSDALIEK